MWETVDQLTKRDDQTQLLTRSEGHGVDMQVITNVSQMLSALKYGYRY